MHGAPEKLTMKAIAEEAGVTITTVSRILNNKDTKYAEATKKKIRAIAARVKYRPNALVRGIQTGRTGTAGVMIPVNSHFYCEVVGGIHETLLDNDGIMLCSWNATVKSASNESLERQIIHHMIDRRVDGIILRPSTEEFERSYFEEIWEREIPLILVDREMSKVETDFVGTDDRLAGRIAAQHLLAHGHRSMLFVGARGASTSRYREDGFRDVLGESPRAACRSIYVSSPKFLDELVARMRSVNRPTAVFCYNDELAVTVIGRLHRDGFRVPGDVSIIGCGNLPARDAIVPLTTLDQHPDEIGRLAARLYLDRVASRERKRFRKELVRPDLIERASVRRIA